MQEIGDVHNVIQIRVCDVWPKTALSTSKEKWSPDAIPPLFFPAFCLRCPGKTKQESILGTVCVSGVVLNDLVSIQILEI